MAPKTNRIKANADIATRAEFEQVLDCIATNQLARDAMVLERDAKLLAIRKQYDDEIGAYEEAIKSGALRAEKFATIHREELFGKTKSAETGLTVFGFRLGNPTLKLLNKKWNWDQVLERIKALGLTSLIVTKEAPDKDAIKAQLDDATLASIGTRIDQSETFFIEPKRDAAADQRIVTDGKAVTA
jgi:phage host-nuclease inhibitor protein Gam